jgi:hypothetical protein
MATICTWLDVPVLSDRDDELQQKAHRISLDHVQKASTYSIRVFNLHSFNSLHVCLQVTKIAVVNRGEGQAVLHTHQAYYCIHACFSMPGMHDTECTSPCANSCVAEHSHDSEFLRFIS